MTAERLCLKNTLTGRKEIFKPLDQDGTVKLVTCGPSIYNRPHIGNYRTFLFEDVLQRYLEYSGYAVKRLINLTDVEDKAVVQASQEGRSVAAITRPNAERFRHDCDLLRIKLPDEPMPRSSTSVDQAVHLIQQLLDKGYAYRHENNIFYDPLKFKGFGKLYGLDMTRWPKKKVRFSRDTYAGNRWNLGDFILWKGCEDPSDHEPSWETALGRGRPSWNVQDPAMITQHLGYQVDISCGGADNLFRHHDYNIAVIEGVSGKTFANTWLHGGHVLVKGRKMSKSRGNVVYPQDLMTRGYRAHHIRFFLTYGHYREKMNMNEERLQLARGKVDTFRDIADKFTRGLESGATSREAQSLTERLLPSFENRMNDDLDVKGAFDAVNALATRLAELRANGNVGPEEAHRIGTALRKMDTVWQFLPPA
jgi:cysteinyl-tRNA synthetase